MSIKPPPPEVRAIIKRFVEIKREKYGPDWKEKLSDEGDCYDKKAIPSLCAADATEGTRWRFSVRSNTGGHGTRSALRD